MFGAEILDVAIGVVFVFLLVSVVCSAIREGIEAWLKTRAAYLERGIRELLHDRNGRGLARNFYEHLGCTRCGESEVDHASDQR